MTRGFRTPRCSSSAATSKVREKPSIGALNSLPVVPVYGPKRPPKHKDPTMVYSMWLRFHGIWYVVYGI